MRVRLALVFLDYINSYTRVSDMDGEINIINQPIIYELVDAIWDIFSEKLQMPAFLHHWAGIQRDTWVAMQHANREALVERCEQIPRTHNIAYRVVLWVDHVIPELIYNEENSWPNNSQYGNYLVELRRFYNSLQRIAPDAKPKSRCTLQ